ncbi:hypothetical protein [Kiloniella antarctica]|uniref:Uncharacterized protein n=1 Tax=Kiloniella antarctica TaxID=1550907 RepID=A0ABW5BKY1_9PROT
MKVTNKQDFNAQNLDASGRVSLDRGNKLPSKSLTTQAFKKEDPATVRTVPKILKPFTGDLRALGVRELLKELFDAAKVAAESGRILRRGSFLNITV